MASKKTRRQKTSRDDELFAFLFRTPAPPSFVFYVSQTFNEPFPSLDKTYRRLAKLVDIGWLSKSADPAAPRLGGHHYYKLTLAGYRVWLQDDQAEPPTKRFFDPIVEPRNHLVSKSKFLSHLTVVAHRRDFTIDNDRPFRTIDNDRPEGTISITFGEQMIEPDHYCELVSPVARRFPYFIEIDCSTETLTSNTKFDDTWRKKNLVYDGHQNQLAGHERFRVIPVTTASQQRLKNILERFAVQNSVANRQLYKGIYLPDFLAERDALCHPIFHDHRRSFVPLVPPDAIARPDPLIKSTTPHAAQLTLV